jgi:DNA polymerase-3 subunit delta'
LAANNFPMLSFDDIIDQDAAVEQLRRCVKADRLPHGLLFSGPVGVGKATTAAALAGWFLCQHPLADTPCGKCESCRAFGTGMHPDYHIITKELIRYHDRTGKSKGIDLSIHVIRPEVVDKAAMKSAMGRGKVFIIEQAELMNPAAQNALLKTLEEPAGRTLLILLTDQIGQLLPTIRSRCQTVRFSAMSEAAVLRELQKRGIPKSVAADAMRFAAGSLGIALRWIADGVIEPAKQLVQQLDNIFAGKPATELPDFFKSAADSYAEKQLERDELSSKDQATREALGLYLKLAAEHIRKKFAQTSDPDDLERACAAIDAIARAEEYVDSNVNIALVFQQLAMALESGAAVS